ncbi:hypothetical protein HDV00_012488 [Rhizophlyctis rosea]|nr:hypothetical protein HDV00_012488 [Rhizophlyctis rosea]
MKEVGEAVGFHCASLSAQQYPEWLFHFIADPAIDKCGFGIDGDVVKLRNIGVTDLEGFIRADDICIYHQKEAAPIYLGCPKATSVHPKTKYERRMLTDAQIDYLITDAQQSLQCVKQYEAQMTAAEVAEAHKYAAETSIWMSHCSGAWGV